LQVGTGVIGGRRWAHITGQPDFGGFECRVQTHCSLQRWCDQIGQRITFFDPGNFSQVGAAACHHMRQKRHGVGIVGPLKRRAIAHRAERRVQSRAHLGGRRAGQHQDHFAGGAGRAVFGPGVKRAAIDHAHIGLLGGLVGGNVGHVVRVSGKEAQAEDAVVKLEFFFEIFLQRRDQPNGAD